ncbi:acyl-CoA dehydrogenase [Streptosporangium becharense]|uniref:Acyl-CoA dehydrogenase n=1 Tax=Streptosporangium becharense TaxID=1816182 RepID=A0A7W9MK01_9ACTN|nr:acyl-CoA dehydrogenase family protein [Streptosporangium becharense]MBB2914368.1 acyl-CoA dehydrogenase [Streptosporangium becharense]MBB5823600.1 acyl-CoA dehydrogenase [Streptosporangium becharense]
MSDDLRAEIRAAVTAILRGRGEDRTRAGGFDHVVWKDLSEAGFHLVGVPEEAGGSGGDLRDLAEVTDLTAFHAAGVPVAETAFLAGWLLAGAGLPVPGGLVVASLDEAHGHWRDGALRLSGRLRVPWARHADHVVTTARCGQDRMVAVIPGGARRPGGPRLVTAENLAGEPRDVLVLEGVAADQAPAAAPPGLDTAALLTRGALARSVQLAAAARAVLVSARRHITEREQFGRPLARFQAVQQHLAALAAEVAAMQVSAEAAVAAVEHADAGAGVAVAAAKATTSAGARHVAAIGHQLHGALGYSSEHRLGAATTRLWAWREEFGNESHWHDHLAAAGGDDGAWWPLLTGGAR